MVKNGGRKAPAKLTNLSAVPARPRVAHVPAQPIIATGAPGSRGPNAAAAVKLTPDKKNT